MWKTTLRAEVRAQKFRSRCSEQVAIIRPAVTPHSITTPKPYHSYHYRPNTTPTLRLYPAGVRRRRNRGSGGPFIKDVANAAHRSDLMRLDVLEEHGGIYVDHDAFVLRSLSQLRRCTGTGVRAGYEYFSRDRHKLNNGVLLARPGARFLALWREAYSKDFRPSEWDYNSCVVPFQLARRSAARTHGLA